MNANRDQQGVSADAIRTIANLDDDKVQAGIDKSSHRTRWAATASVACFLAGVWLDWRFLPTTLVPLTAMCIYGHLAGLGRKELARRQEPAE